jgi:hypothetical protein
MGHRILRVRPTQSAAMAIRCRLLALLLALQALFCTCHAAKPLAHFLGQAEGIEDWLISTRRYLHTFPELMFEEHNTSSTIRSYLDELDIPYQ